jgi:hypothetical protein
VLRPVLERIWVACAAAGKPVGVHSTDGATARRYREAGCTLLSVTVDIAGISRSAEAEARAARSLRAAGQASKASEFRPSAMTLAARSTSAVTASCT